MAKAERTEVFNIDINKFYSIIEDYSSYPDFVDGVSSIEILDKNETSARVKYSINLIKKFKYILKMKQKSPTHLSWKLESGDLFKLNTGSWTLEDLGDGKTKVTYSLEVTFKGFAPKMVIDKLVSSNLPAMMNSYLERAKEL